MCMMLAKSLNLLLKYHLIFTRTLKLWIKSRNSTQMDTFTEKLKNPKLLIGMIAFLGLWILINIVILVVA